MTHGDDYPPGKPFKPEKNGDRDAIARAILEHADAVNRQTEFLRRHMECATKDDLKAAEGRLSVLITTAIAGNVSEKTARLANRLQSALNKLDAIIPDK